MKRNQSRIVWSIVALCVLAGGVFGYLHVTAGWAAAKAQAALPSITRQHCVRLPELMAGVRTRSRDARADLTDTPRLCRHMGAMVADMAQIQRILDAPVCQSLYQFLGEASGNAQLASQVTAEASGVGKMRASVNLVIRQKCTNQAAAGQSTKE